MNIIWKKPTWTNKRVLMAAAGVFVLAAVIVILCLLLRGKPSDLPGDAPGTAPTVTASPRPSAQPATPSPTPEPMITPPALQSGSAASGSDIQVSIQLPATDSDLTPSG